MVILITLWYIATPSTVALYSFSSHGGDQIDPWVIITGLAVIIGLIAGLFQIIDYVLKWRADRRARAKKLVVVAPAPPLPEAKPAAGAPPDEIVPNNLPTRASTLIGRERERAAARELLLGESVRILTFTGPGAPVRPDWLSISLRTSSLISGMGSTLWTWLLSKMRAWSSPQSLRR
ncbi:MAG: hypothetical protein ABIO92_08580 [Chloroflexia bacterium]